MNKPSSNKHNIYQLFYIKHTGVLQHVSRHCQTIIVKKKYYFFKIKNKKPSGGAFSPWQTVATHGVAGGGTVALLEAVDESTVQAGLALLQAPVLFEATAPAGHTPGILSIAKATFLKGLTGEIHRVRGGVGGLGRCAAGEKRA